MTFSEWSLGSRRWYWLSVSFKFSRNLLCDKCHVGPFSALVSSSELYQKKRCVQKCWSLKRCSMDGLEPSYAPQCSPRFSVPQSSLRSLQNLSVDISLEWYMENWFPSEPHSLWELTPGTWPGRFNSAVIGSDHTSTWPNGNLRKMFMATWTSKSRPTPEVAQDLVQSGGSRGRWPQCGPIVSYKPSIWAILPFHVTQASLPSGQGRLLSHP